MSRRGAVESAIPPPKPCLLHAAGHTVHWIQALHTANKPEVARQTWDGTLVAIEGELITIERDGVMIFYRNHEPTRMAAVVANVGRRVRVNDRYCILRMEYGSGAYCFSMARDRGRPLAPCRVSQAGT